VQVELVVYTAGSEEYADAVMDTANIVLAVGGGDVQLPQRRLYRGDCIFDGQRYYKDLCRIDGYDPKRTLLSRTRRTRACSATPCCSCGRTRAAPTSS